MIPDAKYHGERSYEADFASPVTLYSSQDLQKAYSLMTTTVKDIRIIMDYIQKSNNASITFDVIGYSMGGMQTIFLNSVDDRLNRVAVCVSPFNYPKGAQMLGMNEEYANKLDIISPHNNYASLQKAPVTLLMGANDKWYTKEEAQDFFEKININDKTLKFYQSGHYLPKEFIFDAIDSINKE